MDIEILMKEYFKEKSILKKLIENGLCNKCSKVNDLLNNNNAKKGNDNYVMVLFDEIPFGTLNIHQKNPHISNVLFSHYLYAGIKTEYHHSNHNIDKDTHFCLECMTILQIEHIDHIGISVLELKKLTNSLYSVVRNIDYMIEKYKKSFIDKMNSTNQSLLKDFNDKKQKELLKSIVSNDFFEFIEVIKLNYSNEEILELAEDFVDSLNDL